MKLKILAAIGLAAIAGLLFVSNRSEALNMGEVLSGKPDLTKLTDEDVVIGKADAPVTIIEYASLSCPHCAHFHTKVLPELQKRYIDSGKVKLTLRPYPLNEPALKGAMLAQCAGKDRYYTFAKVMFETQDRWAYSTDFLNSLSTIAGVGGIGKEQFDKCMADKDIEKSILLSRKQASDVLGVNSTPTFFINGKKLETGFSIENFAAVIDPLLGTAVPTPKAGE